MGRTVGIGNQDNPWSIVNYLDKGRAASYWANSISNSLIGKLVRQGSKDLKTAFETLLQGNPVTEEIDEQIVYNQLDDSDQAIWSLLLAGASSSYNDFIKALLLGNVKAMNTYMNKVALAIFSYFDTGKNPSGEEPERFYHGFVLGLLVELSDRYILTSNRESGFGRYDVMLEPRRPEDDGIILELKVDSTPEEAIRQIKDKQYGLRFRGKLGEEALYSGRILAVGISYDKRTKEHRCKVEVL